MRVRCSTWEFYLCGDTSVLGAVILSFSLATPFRFSLLSPFCSGVVPVTFLPSSFFARLGPPGAISEVVSVGASGCLALSLGGHVTCRQPVPMTLSIFLHGVEASHLASCRDSNARFPFLFPRYLARVSFAQQNLVAHSLSAYMWRRASRFIGICPCFSVLRLPEQFRISCVTSEFVFTESEIEFFISSAGNFIHFGQREEVEESSDRWEDWTLGQ